MALSDATSGVGPAALVQRGVHLSRLAFGGAPIGNLYAPVDEAAAREAIERAWQQDIRHFDTAPYYGYGLSERRLGESLRHLDRHTYTLSTKVGRLVEDRAGRTDRADGFAVDDRAARFDYSYEGVLRSVEASLARLHTDHVELLLLHDIGALTHGGRHREVMRQALDEALPAMAELRRQGVCRAIGIGVNEEAVCLEVMQETTLDAIMLAGRYTLFEQQRSRAVMDQALRRGVAILAAGPYNSGLLADARAPGGFYDYRPAGHAVRLRAQQFYDLCAAAGVDVGAAALQFPLAHPAVATVVCGLRSAAEVDAAAERLRAVVPSDLWRRLVDTGLLDTSVPTL